MENRFIIMADVIGSRNLDGKAVMARLSAATRQVNVEFLHDLLSPLTITLGDEYQGIAPDLSSAMNILFMMEELCVMKEVGFKLRHVVWYGEIDTGINPLSAHGMIGAGLTAAREELAALKDSNQRFSIHTGDRDADSLFTPALNLYQFFVDDWSEKDYPVIASFLGQEDYKKVAAELGRDVSLMWRRERSLHIREYRDIKKLLILLSQPGSYDFK